MGKSIVNCDILQVVWRAGKYARLTLKLIPPLIPDSLKSWDIYAAETGPRHL